VRAQFVVWLIATSFIFTFSVLPQDISANPDDNESEISYQAVETNISKQDSEGSKFIEVGKQIQIMSDVTNKQDRPQPFAYIVQIKNENGVVVSLGWLTGELSPGQFLSPALSWIPEHAGVYTATIFVWEGINNPSALSSPCEITLDVR